MKQLRKSSNPIDFSARKAILGLRRAFCGAKYYLPTQELLKIDGVQ